MDVNQVMISAVVERAQRGWNAGNRCIIMRLPGTSTTYVDDRLNEKVNRILKIGWELKDAAPVLSKSILMPDFESLWFTFLRPSK